jgi:hypothetical protein
MEILTFEHGTAAADDIVDMREAGSDGPRGLKSNGAAIRPRHRTITTTDRLLTIRVTGDQRLHDVLAGRNKRPASPGMLSWHCASSRVGGSGMAPGTRRGRATGKLEGRQGVSGPVVGAEAAERRRRLRTAARRSARRATRSAAGKRRQAAVTTNLDRASPAFEAARRLTAADRPHASSGDMSR